MTQTLLSQTVSPSRCPFVSFPLPKSALISPSLNVQRAKYWLCFWSWKHVISCEEYLMAVWGLSLNTSFVTFSNFETKHKQNKITQHLTNKTLNTGTALMSGLWKHACVTRHDISSVNLPHKHVSHRVHYLPRLMRFPSLNPLSSNLYRRVGGCWEWSESGGGGGRGRRRSRGWNLDQQTVHFSCEGQRAQERHFVESLLLFLLVLRFVLKLWGIDCLVAAEAIWLQLYQDFMLWANCDHLHG